MSDTKILSREEFVKRVNAGRDGDVFEHDADLRAEVQRLTKENTDLKFFHEQLYLSARKTIKENPGLEKLGPYDDNPLKMWHGIFSFLSENLEAARRERDEARAGNNRTSRELGRALGDCGAAIGRYVLADAALADLRARLEAAEGRQSLCAGCSAKKINEAIDAAMSATQEGKE